MPCSVVLSDSVRLADRRNRNHGHSLVDVPDCERSVSSHGAVDSTWCQMSTHFSIIAIGWNCSDHISWINILQGRTKAFLFAKFYDLSLQKNTDILNNPNNTGNFLFPDWSTYTPCFKFYRSLTPLPAP